ncbi:MAG: sulfite exporter TauE/SafE family protein [Lentisphaeraceae bacterium]|nr:sulfite exporter TauE/SafE family protein [Lentisphaeraceae bacterium]
MDSEIFSQLSTQDWVLLYITGMIIGFAKTGIAGIGILAVPIFAMIFPAEKSAGILLPVLCVADVMAVSYYRRHADWKKIGPLMPWVLSGLLGATAVYYFGNQQGTALEHFIKETMKPTMGCIVLFVLLLSMWRETHQEIPEVKKIDQHFFSSKFLFYTLKKSAYVLGVLHAKPQK